MSHNFEPMIGENSLFCSKALKMSIQSEKLKLIQLLINTENLSIIEQVKAIFQKSNEKDLWLELTDSQQIEINNAIQESVDGQTIDYDKFMSAHRK